MDRYRRWNSLCSRRDFLWLSAQGGTALLLSGCAGSLVKTLPNISDSKDFIWKYGPIDRTEEVPSTVGFSGDRNQRPHQILWNLPDFLATHSVESEEEVPLVVIGGGMSGLFTAYGLRKHRPIILEQAARLGGNAKGQSWRGLTYALGSAYIDLPRPGTPMDQLYRELDLENMMVGRENADPVEYDGKIIPDFWEGESEAKFKEKYLKMNRLFSDLYAEKEWAFPFIPVLKPGHLKSLRHFDRTNLHTFMTRFMGGKIPAHLETALEYFCWSTYASSSKELSAAAALNFLAQEASPIRVGAGGNASIGERVLERILKEVPKENLRTSSIVVQVRVLGDQVHVLYVDSREKLRKVIAKCAVMACPKFIASKLLDGIEDDRKNAIRRIKYRSYMTANLLVNKPPKHKFYDLFMVGNGMADLNNVRAAQEKRNATDFVLANFADQNDKVSVLTFYNAFPFDGARGELNTPSAYEAYKRRFEKQVIEQVLPLMGFSPSDVVDLRLTLWGHALPVAATGIFSDGTIDQLRKPFRERVFFIEQDNWAYPSLQTGATESVLMKEQIQKVLA